MKKIEKGSWNWRRNRSRLPVISVKVKRIPRPNSDSTWDAWAEITDVHGNPITTFMLNTSVTYDQLITELKIAGTEVNVVDKNTCWIQTYDDLPREDFNVLARRSHDLIAGVVS